MADTKITALAAITTVDPANDVLPIVDVSDTSMAASGTTKKITTNQILGASGTATLASATITGDLTVRTNKLAVTSTNVGIGTASPTLAAGIGLEIENAGIATLRLQNTSGANAFELQVDSDANGVLYRGYNNSPHVFYVNNSTAMTLNSTGLGVGEAASVARLQPRGSTSDSSAYVIYAKNSGGSVINFMRNDGRFLVGNGTTDNFIVTETGNVGIGVTPSAWNNTYNVLDIGQNGSISGRTSTNNSVDIVSNGFRNAGGTWVYKLATSNAASRYLIDGASGGHLWYSGAAGTAGNTIAGFSTATMTLDASGRLILLASTTTPATLSTNGQLTFTATSDTNLRFSYRGSDGVTRVANITLA